ncbi:MAG: family 10 glycosylhydrolase [Armatimonadetes bacterium]|nr:family 10 glycosylhydrolase [Armatimonadota bacterium]
MRTALLWAVLCVASVQGAEPELRGAWLWGVSASSPAKADALLERARVLRLNALYVLTFYFGSTSAHRSELVPMNASIEPGFDPLGYLIEKGKPLGIEVHAWLIAGSSSGPSKAPWFEAHPNWQARGMGGEPLPWFDLMQPAVREFEADLMLEVARKYDVAGVHFDYIRFENKNVRSTDEVMAEAERQLGFTLAQLSPEKLPLLSYIRGNPVAAPTTAVVHAEFDDGVPAIAVNEVGQGRVVLFNFNAYRLAILSMPAIDQAMRGALESLGAKAGGEVLLLDSDLNAAKYGRSGVAEATNWLKRLGFAPRIIKDADLAQLPAKAVVFLMNHYQMDDAQAGHLLGHARAGGGVLFNDAPINAFPNSPRAAELLGFKQRGTFISSEKQLRACGLPGSFVPGGGQDLPIERMRAMQAAWDQWRKDQVTALVALVSQRLKAEQPDTMLTCAVFQSTGSASYVLQDWPRWVREKLVDYVIPMSYTRTAQELDSRFADWRTVDPTLARIVPSIGLTLTLREGVTPEGHAAKVAEQIEVCRAQKAPGFVIFRLEQMADVTAQKLSETVLREPAPAWRPAHR